MAQSKVIEQGLTWARSLKGEAKEWYQRVAHWLLSTDFQTQVTKYLEKNPGLQSLPYWLAAAAVGLIAVGYAEIFEYATELSKRLLAFYPIYIFFFGPVCFVLAWWIVESCAPKAAGSGIPQLRAAIEMEGSTPRRFFLALVGLRTSFIKVVSSLLCVLGGGAIGREGPTIQIAASIFHAVGLQSRKIWPRTGHQPWLIAGGAAGLAAAFNTPLGGIVFALEELAPQYFVRFRTVLISAVIIAGMVAQWIWGPYLYFGFPTLESASVAFIPWAILMGGICGVSGGYFGKGLRVGAQKVRTVANRFWFAGIVGLGTAAVILTYRVHFFFVPPIGVAITAGAGIGSLGYFLATRILGKNAEVTPEQNRAWFVAFAGLCVVFVASQVGDRVFGGGAEVVRTLLFDPEAVASAGLVAGRIFNTLLSYISGAAGGIFSPSLAIGGVIGSWIESLVDTGNPNLMVLLGMTGFLSAVTRAPFTALVLVFEMTDLHSAIFTLMVVSLSANVVARLIDSKSFYEHVMEDLMAELPSKKAD